MSLMMSLMMSLPPPAARDACAVENGGCSADAVCKRTLPGRRECVCNSGYYGDGLVCVGRWAGPGA